MDTYSTYKSKYLQTIKYQQLNYLQMYTYKSKYVQAIKYCLKHKATMGYFQHCLNGSRIFMTGFRSWYKSCTKSCAKRIVLGELAIRYVQVEILLAIRELNFWCNESANTYKIKKKKEERWIYQLI